MRFTDYKALEDGGIIGRNGTRLSLIPKKNGYLHFSASVGVGCPNQTLVHRFIWESFNGPIPDGLVVDHINGNRHDNRLINLQLITQAENCRKGVNVKLTWDLVRQIRGRANEKQKDLAEEFGVSFQTINNILHGRRWCA